MIPRCDVCSCHSVGDRQLPYGGVLKDADGTMTCVCRDCFDEFVPLTISQRCARWPRNETTMKRLEHLDDVDVWDPLVRDAFRGVAAKTASVCIPGYVIRHRYAPDTTPPISYEQGHISAFVELRAAGEVLRGDMTLDVAHNTRTDLYHFVASPTRRLRCIYCSRVESEQGHHKMCGACTTVFYCDQQCQRAHWVVHKPLCETARTKK